MATSSPLIFFGNERLSTAYDPQGAPVLEALINNGYDIAAVVSNFEPGRSRKQRVLEIEEVARRNNIPVLLPKKLTEIEDELRALNPVAGILIAYGKIIPSWLINLFPKGIINIHPSLLPAYRGPTPIEQAILDGLTETGVSLMLLGPTMDAGPLFAQQKVPLLENETKQALTQKLHETGKRLLLTHLPAILDGHLPPSPQNDAEATYCQLLTKDSGTLEWSKSAETLAREVRAFAGWPQSKASFTLSEKQFEIIVTQAQAVTIPDSLSQGQAAVSSARLLIGTGNGALEVLQLKVPGKKEIAASEFIRGYRL